MTPNDELVLGIDGGGSKTAAWLARCGSDGEPVVLGRGGAGASNPMVVGEAEALASMSGAVAEAQRSAGLDEGRVAAAVVAVAGSDRPQTREPILRWAQQRVAHQVRVVHDAAPVLAAGSPDGWGVALISGTGSFGYGEDRGGRSVRVGGWGYLLGDEGSGYAIALAALRAAAKAADGRGPATRLLLDFQTHFECREPLELIGAVARIAQDRAAIALLAGYVFSAAAAGDPVAGELVGDAADELAIVVRAVASALGFAAGAFPLALAGGVLLGESGLRESVIARVQQLGLDPAPIALVPEPVAGAVRLAARLRTKGA